MWFRRDKSVEQDVYKKLIDNLEKQIEGLKEEKKELMSMVNTVFKALASKEAPMYYQDMMAKENPKTPYQQKKEELAQKQQEIYNEYINQLEKEDLFSSPEELQKMLTQLDADDVISKVMPNTIETPQSLHNNEES